MEMQEIKLSDDQIKELALRVARYLNKNEINYAKSLIRKALILKEVPRLNINVDAQIDINTESSIENLKQRFYNIEKVGGDEDRLLIRRMIELCEDEDEILDIYRSYYGVAGLENGSVENALAIRKMAEIYFKK